MQTIRFETGLHPEVEDIIELYKSAGLNRPVQDPARIAKMYTHSNLVISAWEADELVGIARSLTDFCYCCYLSDLAVMDEYKKTGIGKKLIELTREKIGPQSSLILLSAPGAMEYYPKVGFEHAQNAFIKTREN